MVYRIHLTGGDPVRTRVAQSPMPLSELDFASRTLQAPRLPVWLHAWRQRVVARLTPACRMPLSLIPAVGWSPSFACPARSGTYEELLERVRVALFTSCGSRCTHH
ncbi:hypothetical protein [Streptomyces sp. ODS28]|uniref:hypothetical protein n=1 Tax=Streptomyces sp. ODS28 TaxID=3136688 RepID=UPI0031EA5E7C